MISFSLWEGWSSEVWKSISHSRVLQGLWKKRGIFWRLASVLTSCMFLHNLLNLSELQIFPSWHHGNITYLSGWSHRLEKVYNDQPWLGPPLALSYVCPCISVSHVWDQTTSLFSNSRQKRLGYSVFVYLVFYFRVEKVGFTMWRIIKRFWQLQVTDVHCNVWVMLEASYSYLAKLSGQKAILVIKVIATVIKISRVCFHHVAAQVTKRRAENITMFYRFYDLERSFYAIEVFIFSQTLEGGHYYSHLQMRKLIIKESMFCQRSFSK